MKKVITPRKFDKRVYLALLVGVIVGAFVSYLYFQPKITMQEKIVSELRVDANQNQIDVLTYKSQLASASAELTSLLAKPSPTPRVVYKTEYVQSQDSGGSTNCRPDYAGGMYCSSSSGVQTHCTSNYAGGMNCN